MVRVRNDERRMVWPTYKSASPYLAKEAVGPDTLTRLKMAGEIAHATLEKMPKKIARLYSKQMIQLQDTIEKLRK
jgi:hypothetical protein